jgi:quinol monooxygenase YgiN
MTVFVAGSSGITEGIIGNRVVASGKLGFIARQFGESTQPGRISQMVFMEYRFEASASAHRLDASLGRSKRQMFSLASRIVALPGRRDALAKVLLEGSRDVPGCLSYVIAQDRRDERVLYINEVWESEASHRCALSLPHVKSSTSAAMRMIAGVGLAIDEAPEITWRADPNQVPLVRSIERDWTSGLHTIFSRVSAFCACFSLLTSRLLTPMCRILPADTSSSIARMVSAIG